MCGRLVTAIVMYVRLTVVWTFGNGHCAVRVVACVWTFVNGYCTVRTVDCCVDVW